MKKEWILIANASVARLLERAADDAPLVPLLTFDHEASHRKTSELADDRMGHDSTDNRPGGVSFEPRTDALRKEHQAFARMLAHRLDAGLQSGACARISLFASAPFIGELKAQLGPAATRALRAAVPLDLTSFGLAELEQRIAHALQALAPPHRA